MPAHTDHRTGARSVDTNLLDRERAVRNHRGRGYFYVRLTGCLIAGSLLAGGFLLGEGTAQGAPGSSNLAGAENYDLVYTTTTSPTPAPPKDTSPPSISGSLIVGGTLTAAPGTWTNSPTSFSYQWVECNTSGTKCTVIPGATGSAYNITTSDIGHTIRVLVTASNASGHASVVAAATGAVPVPEGEITNVLTKNLTPSGNSASINSILKNGGYVLTFNAPEGGTVTIAWYDVPAGATVASAHAKHKPTLVATGKHTFSKAAPAS
jgi:hypothetical protein